MPVAPLGGCMKKEKLFAGVLLTLLVASGVSFAYAYDDDDFQVWHTEVQEKEINQVSRVALEEEFRFADNASKFYYHHYDLGYSYDMNKHFTLGINYRQVYEKKNGDFKIENRPHLNATLKTEILGFQCDDRSRLEYRHFTYQEDSWRYRNKLTLKFPWKFTAFKIQPYIADEIFLDLNGIDLNRNRFYAGIGFSLTENVKGEVFYLLQSSRNPSSWTDANVLGTKLKLLF
jgi:hypothetical protein